MKFRALRGFGVSANRDGTVSQYVPTGSVINATEDWQIDLLETLVDAGMAEHDKMIDDPLEKKETAVDQTEPDPAEGQPDEPTETEPEPGSKSRRKSPSKAKRQTKGK